MHSCVVSDRYLKGWSSRGFVIFDDEVVNFLKDHNLTITRDRYSGLVFTPIKYRDHTNNGFSTHYTACFKPDFSNLFKVTGDIDSIILFKLTF